MYRFRILLILTAAWLTLIFNLERPDILGMGNIDLASMVYVLCAAVMLLIILMPEVGKKPAYYSFLPLLAVYGISKLILQSHKISEPMFLYITVTEIVVLFITLRIARIVSHAVADFEYTVEKAVLGPTGTHIYNSTEGKQVIDSELLRARRYDRSVALLYVQIKELSNIANHPSKYVDSKKAFEHRYLQRRIINTVKGLLHDSDILAWNNGGLVVCMPETSGQRAVDIARKLDELIKLDMKVGISSFPSDALVYTDLVEAAKENPWHPNKEFTFRPAELFFTKPAIETGI